jgi:RNA polymerase sigma-70 factor (ECF subfamily)
MLRLTGQAAAGGQGMKTMDLRELYDRHQAGVRAFIASLVRDWPLADDLCQETFLRALEHDGDLADPTRARPWLFRIARNLSLDHLRRRAALGSRQEELLPDLPDLPGLPELQDGLAPLTQALLERREMSACVRSKVAFLPPEQASIIHLHDLAGLSHAEIAQVLQISEGAAKVRLHRARRALKQVLERECAFERDERDVLVCLPKP